MRNSDSTSYLDCLVAVMEILRLVEESDLNSTVYAFKVRQLCPPLVHCKKYSSANAVK